MLTLLSHIQILTPSFLEKKVYIIIFCYLHYSVYKYYSQLNHAVYYILSLKTNRFPYYLIIALSFHLLFFYLSSLAHPKFSKKHINRSNVYKSICFFCVCFCCIPTSWEFFSSFSCVGFLVSYTVMFSSILV